MTTDSASLPNSNPPGPLGGRKERGAVFTAPAVVDFMLDLIGYRQDAPLASRRILEPSFGGGVFLLRIVERLLSSHRAHGGKGVDSLEPCVRAVEMDHSTFTATRGRLRGVILEQGFTSAEADLLLDSWLIEGDFLTVPLDGAFDYVVGNPPYIRQEALDPAALALYRRRYRTMIGRADIYVPFFERSLSLLSPSGTLSFICSDSWVKNAYGRELRALIAHEYGMDAYFDMYMLPAFEKSVGAYTSITRIRRSPVLRTLVAQIESVEDGYLQDVARAADTPERSDPRLAPLPTPTGSSPWLLSPDPGQTIIRRLEEAFPTLEDAGCRIGIGVATGADRVFIGRLDALDVEDDRKLPLATGKDIVNGALAWDGRGIINPWADDGSLVDLSQYPRLSAYLRRFWHPLAKRHTAKRDPQRLWYRTIDRIVPSLTTTPKLLIPDIRDNADSIAYDAGTVYPHHGLYHITSTSWDLRALRAILRSGLAALVVRAYSTKLGGGYFRFQAQNLRRIHLPAWDSLETRTRRELSRVGRLGGVADNSLLAEALGITESESKTIKRAA